MQLSSCQANHKTVMLHLYQPWSGEANVHVSVANWVKHPAPSPKLTKREQSVVTERLLIPQNRRLWFKVEADPEKKRIRKKGSGPASKEYELAFREASQINSALSDAANVSEARALGCNGVWRTSDGRSCRSG